MKKNGKKYHYLNTSDARKQVIPSQKNTHKIMNFIQNKDPCKLLSLNKTNYKNIWMIFSVFGKKNFVFCPYL